MGPRVPYPPKESNVKKGKVYKIDGIGQERLHYVYREDEECNCNSDLVELKKIKEYTIGAYIWLGMICVEIGVFGILIVNAIQKLHQGG